MLSRNLKLNQICNNLPRQRTRSIYQACDKILSDNINNNLKGYQDSDHWDVRMNNKNRSTWEYSKIKKKPDNKHT